MLLLMINKCIVGEMVIRRYVGQQGHGGLRGRTGTAMVTPNSRGAETEVCTCVVAKCGGLHSSDCPFYSRIELNRIKPPDAPAPELKLRRPEGLSTHAVDLNVDLTSPEDHMTNIAEQLERYLSIGETKAALYLMDLDYSKKKEKESGTEYFVATADYVKNLARIHEWDRIYTFLNEQHLYQLHLFFGYYYVAALYNLKQYTDLIEATVGHLLPLEPVDLGFESSDTPLPLKRPAMNVLLLNNTQFNPTEDETKYLDRQVEELKLLPAFLGIYGKTFIAQENRTAAQRFLWSAWLRDKANMELEELITRYNFPDNKRRQAQWDKFVSRRTYLSPCNDPRALLTTAQSQFASNNIRAAYEYTKIILKENGIYRPALLLHINCAVAMKDDNTLFTLAHNLVTRNPLDEISWYAVAMYYFVIGNNGAAKNFMNKCTMMCHAFGEAWVAFGHILSEENEHEQAMNCYLRAFRLLERHQDIQVFMAMGYCRSNNMKLAENFLKDTANLYPSTSDNTKAHPYREHEKGCVNFSQKNFAGALICFTRALRAVCPEGIEKMGQYSRDRILQLDRFWEALISNLAHTHRRLGEYAKAVLLYECALVLCPLREVTLIGLGLCLASQGDSLRATSQLHKALALNPYNTTARQTLDKIVGHSEDAEDLFDASDDMDSVTTGEDYSLDTILQTMTPRDRGVNEAGPRSALLLGNRRFATSSAKRPNFRTGRNNDGMSTPAGSSRAFPGLPDLSPIPADAETGDEDANVPMDTVE